jgi:hypothetical protein
MSCLRSTASTESAVICLRASGCRWVIACPAREDAAVAPRSSFQPITCLRQFEGLSIKHGPLFEPCPPRAKVTRSNRVGCARASLSQSALVCVKAKLTTNSPKVLKGWRGIGGDLARPCSPSAADSKKYSHSDRTTPFERSCLGKGSAPLPLSLTCLRSACRAGDSRSRPQGVERGRGTRQR